MNTLVNKPWGSYEDFYRTDECVFKKLVLKPGHSISYQRHEKRGEIWYVTSGEGVIKTSVSDQPLLTFSQAVLSPGETVEIFPGVWHQLINPESNVEDLVIYEMQYGTCFEDDIERIDDPYNRD